MNRDLFFITAPILPSDTPAINAVIKTLWANSFGVLEYSNDNTFRFHFVGDLIKNIHNENSPSLRVLETKYSQILDLSNDPQEIPKILQDHAADLAIRTVTSWGTDSIAQIAGVKTSGNLNPKKLGEILFQILRLRSYRCANNCSDPSTYPNSGTCAYGHPLVQKE